MQSSDNNKNCLKVKKYLSIRKDIYARESIVLQKNQVSVKTGPTNQIRRVNDIVCN